MPNKAPLLNEPTCAIRERMPNEARPSDETTCAVSERMPNEVCLLDELTCFVRERIPENRFLKRDRRDALFVTDYDGEIDGFVQTRRGALTALTPDKTLLLRYEAAHPQPVGAFSASLERFRGESADVEILRLFAQGVKLTGGCTDGELSAFDKSARQSAAKALRTGIGGGIFALAILRDELDKQYYHDRAGNPARRTQQSIL